MEQYETQTQKLNHIIAISSQISAVITNTLLLPLDVIKIRQQSYQLFQSNPSLYKAKNKQRQFFKDINPHSIKQIFQKISQKEGYSTFLNGLKYNIILTCGFNLTMFLSYENLKSYTRQQLTKRYNNKFNNNSDQRRINHISIFVASVLSQGIATTFTLPFEYFKTLQQSQVGKTGKTGFQLGNKIYSAYLVNIYYNLTFFAFYWPIVEELKSRLLYQGIYSNEIINIVSGSVGGGVAALSSQPLDVIKTRKQLCPEQNKKSTFAMMNHIVKDEGIQGLFVGYKPRTLKLTLYGSMILTLYEFSYKQILNISTNVDTLNFI